MRSPFLLRTSFLLVVLILVQGPTPATGRIYLPGDGSSAGLPNPLVEEMLAQVDPNEVYTLTGNLSGEWPVSIEGEPYTIETRYSLSGEPIQKAASYLSEYYQSLGLDVSLEEFVYNSETLSNVVAEKRGSFLPERVYLITSHYDDLPTTPPAPGADDNASGTVGVMVAAEILSQYNFGCTLRFVNFAAEEQGLVGSNDYAKKAYCDGEDVRGVINLDMIGWNSAGSPPQMDLHAHGSVPGSTAIANLYQEVIAAYELTLEPTLAVPAISASDHGSFWKYGFPAILAIEDLSDFNPNYHTDEDILENLADLDYYTEMVKASLGTFAHLGCLIEEPTALVTGTVVDSVTELPIVGAHLTLINQEADWGYSLSFETDEVGFFQFETISGWHSLYADGAGYPHTLIDEIHLELGELATSNAELEPIEETTLYFPLAERIPTPVPTDCP